MALSAELRAWLLDGSDPSVRYRVLRELLDRPEDDPEVSAARKEIGVRGWAAEILARQLPEGQWVTPGTTAQELYRPEYSLPGWRWRSCQRPRGSAQVSPFTRLLSRTSPRLIEDPLGTSLRAT